MEAGQQAAGQSGAGREQRSHVRFPVDGDATLLLLNGSPPLRCRIVDLSLRGCRIRGQQRIWAAKGTGLEINFKVNGISFRFNGTIQWTDSRNQAGVQFPSKMVRQAEDLETVLEEVETAARKKAAEEQGAETAAPQAPLEAAGQTDRAASAAPVSPSLPQPEPVRSSRDRRAQAREAVDTTAIICVVKSGSRLSGRIVDLSLGGCRIRTAERFLLGIYTRVEVEFRLQGMPFRLAGVIQSVQDQFAVGIRFLDMSQRKQSDVMELIAEIHSLHQASPKPGEDAASAP